MQSGTGKIRAVKCDKNSPSQQFEYDKTTGLIRNPNRNNLCIDDGGGDKNGQTKFRMLTCDKNSINQHFIYDEKNKLMKNKNKNICVDDDGTITSNTRDVQGWECIVGNKNQEVEFFPVTGYKLLNDTDNSSSMVEGLNLTGGIESYKTKCDSVPGCSGFAVGRNGSGWLKNNLSKNYPSPGIKMYVK